MNLGEIDQLETQGHTFHRVHLQKKYDFWECQFAVDGVLRQGWIEPHSNVADLSDEQFLTYLHAQALGQPNG